MFSEKRPGTGRPLVIYDPIISQEGIRSKHPSILRYAPGIQQLPEELVRVAMELRSIEREYLEKSRYLQDLRLAHARVPVERVATIKIEIDELEVRNEALQQEVKVKRSEFLPAAIAHSQTCCRRLSKSIVQSLPREIRDMIYTYLCDRVRRISIRPTIVPPGRDTKSLEENVTIVPYTDRVETPLPNFFSQKYLHKDFLLELVSNLYQNATFHIWDADDVSAFLTQDVLHTGCIPKDHVRKLSLVVFTDEYGARCASRRQIREKVAKLNHLLDIRHREGFHLDLHLCISRMKQRPTVARFHQLLLPYLYDLQAAGFAMRFPLKKHHYNVNRRSDRSQMNQLQASESLDPADWVVDDEELAAWGASEAVQKAFKKSESLNGTYLRDSEDEYSDFDENLENYSQPDSEDWDVDSDDEGGSYDDSFDY